MIVLQKKNLTSQQSVNEVGSVWYVSVWRNKWSQQTIFKWFVSMYSIVVTCHKSFVKHWDISLLILCLHVFYGLLKYYKSAANCFEGGFWSQTSSQSVSQWCAVLVSHSPVDQNIRMGGLPHQRTKLHDRDEASEVLHFLSLIFAIHHTRQIEQLGSLTGSNTMCVHKQTIFN